MNAMSLVNRNRNELFGSTIVVFVGSTIELRQGCTEYMKRQRKRFLNLKSHLTVYEVYTLAGNFFSKLFIRALKPIIRLRSSQSKFTVVNAESLEVLRLFCEMHFNKKYTALC
ncbi:hypothetical protein [Trichoplusia ni ascovirus 2c]|uniref:hypothetical protein n=1 Tax=Trichoplusia ni ascovirus 2c TaxID=328615 RepID=UPI0000E4421C|nr:hypothetical protein TNAV2c_gp068 [Trichoplusia ni ascovirus 2c]ABF70585.1 hypothetical protein [Trichoplusia ni ascovirus 2c]